MNGTAFVQRQGNDWLNVDCYQVAQGFSRMSYDVIPFEFNDKLALHKDAIYYGGIQTSRKIFDLLGVKQPEIHNPHEYLPQYCKRKFEETNVADVLDGKYKFPFFIKPLVDLKLFTGFAARVQFDLMQIRMLPPETKLLYSEYKEIVSEFRCFVHRGNLQGCKNYTGYFTVLPDFNDIENAIRDYKNQPVAYSIDFAVTKDGETILIEINDAFGLGMYGFNNIKYCLMIRDRWKQIMRGE